MHHLLNLQPYQKLRVINNHLHIDERKGASIQRRLSGDSRWRVLTLIHELARNEEQNRYYLEHVINILLNTTYKNDPHWVNAMNLCNPYKVAAYSEFLLQ